jgi:hypothetical protein
VLFFWLTGKQGTGKDLGTWKVQTNREKKFSCSGRGKGRSGGTAAIKA